MPYCYPVTPDEFEIGIRCHEERDDEPYADLSDESFLVVENGDSTILGFAHVAIWRKGEEASRIGLYPIEELLNDRIGLIRFFHYRAGARPAGQALLEAAEKHLRDSGINQIRAFSYYGYRFYRFCHAFQSDKMGHVGALLSMNDYRITRGILLLEFPDFIAPNPVSPDPDVITQFDICPGRGKLPNMEFQLFRFPWFYIEGSPAGQSHQKCPADNTLGNQRTIDWAWFCPVFRGFLPITPGTGNILHSLVLHRRQSGRRAGEQG